MTVKECAAEITALCDQQEAHRVLADSFKDTVQQSDLDSQQEDALVARYKAVVAQLAPLYQEAVEAFISLLNRIA
jgi:hypothetical protein